MKRIVCATNLTPAAETAFTAAVRVAKEFDSEITVLYAIKRNSGGWLARYLRPAKYDHDDEILHFHEVMESYRKIAKKLKLDPGKLKPVAKLGSSITQVIRKTCNKLDPGLVILGMHCPKDRKGPFPTSMAAEILGTVNQSVLVIPENCSPDFQIERIAYPTKFRSNEGKILKRVLQFSRLTNAEVHCVHIDLSHTAQFRQNTEDFKEKFGKHPQVHFHEVDAMDFYKGLNSFMEEKAIDLLAIGTHQRTFLQELFDFSKAKMLATRCDLPLLAIHEETMKEFKKSLKRARKRLAAVS